MKNNNLNININLCHEDFCSADDNSTTVQVSESAIKTIDSYWLGQAMGEVNHPRDIDERTSKAGLEPTLLNPYFAQQADLSALNIPGVQQGLAIPVQISDRKEGRKSVFFAGKDQPVNDMMIATPSGMIASEITRTSGNKERAKEGDQYVWSLKSLTGKTIFSINGKLDSLSEAGEGRLVFGEGGHGEPGGGEVQGLTVIIICTWLSFYKEVRHIRDGNKEVTVVRA